MFSAQAYDDSAAVWWDTRLRYRKEYIRVEGE
jgi:hypothetical protein